MFANVIPLPGQAPPILSASVDASVVVLVTCWPFDAVSAGGTSRYVVTARQAF